MSEYIHQAWPSWRYGPNGEAKVFQSEAAVPAGWKKHPDEFAKKASAAPAAAIPPTETTKAPSTSSEDADLDADGWPYDPALHAATKTRTTAGLWRMKVGVSRPDPKEGYPEPTALDL